MFLLTSTIQNCSGSPSQCNKTRKGDKSLQIEKRRNKTIFTDGRIVYGGNLKINNKNS